MRRIFEWYEHGVSVPEITRRLTAAGYRKPSLKLSKKDAWDESRIHYMIRNEKYVGDLIVQKFVTEDHITHRIRLNEGAAPSKYIRDHHEPIVSRKQFERCNTIFKLKTRTARRSASTRSRTTSAVLTAGTGSGGEGLGYSRRTAISAVREKGHAGNS